MVINSRVIPEAGKAVALVSLSLFLLTACQSAPVVNGRFVSEKGVNIEATFPADTFMLVKLGTRDAEQLANLKTLNAYFPDDPLGSLVKEFSQGFKEGTKNQNIGLDFEKDVLPILNEKTEIYFAGAPGEAGSVSKIKGILAMTLADEGKFDDLLNKQTDQGNFTKQTYNEYTYYLPKNQAEATAMIMRVKDTAFLFTDLDTMKSSLDNLTINNVVLNSNKIYQRAFQNYTPALAFAYGDFGKVMDFMKSSGPSGEETVKALGQVTLNEAGLGMVESEVITARAEKDGLRFVATLLGKDNTDFTKVAGDMSKPYLVDKIPAKYPVIYTEAYNLKQVYDNFSEVAKKDAQMDKGLKDMKAFLTEQNLDFDKDIMSFLTKGYAFVLEDSDSVIPALGLYIDASGNPGGAVKTAQQIDKSVEEIWQQTLKENPQLNMVLSKEEVIKGQLWKFKLNLDTLLVGAPTEVVKKLTGQKIEFYYGVLPANVMVFAFKPDLETVYGKSPTVAEADEYKQALGYLKGVDQGVTFLSPAQIFVYADRVLSIIQQSGGTAADLTEYELIKKYLQPIKSFSTAAATVQKDQARVEAFLHIAQ